MRLERKKRATQVQGKNKTKTSQEKKKRKSRPNSDPAWKPQDNTTQRHDDNQKTQNK